ncbi:hypothetical protein HOY80DRAFT_1005373 [Tuber brumale]|nr:hypothetical protein HOY80DRAFT_1005373 [Tuber brumale]
MEFAVGAASRGPNALLPQNPAMSILRVLAAENKIDELANQICRMALGTTGAAIGGTIGRLGGPVGMIIGAALGGIVGGMLGDLGYAEFKRWLFTEGEDGVRPIDRVAGKLRAATDILRAAAEVEAVIASGQREVFSANGRNGRGFRGI